MKSVIRAFSMTGLISVSCLLVACSPLQKEVHAIPGEPTMPTSPPASKTTGAATVKLGMDLGFRFQAASQTCMDENGKAGLNPGLIGECGQLTSDYFPTGLDNADLAGVNLRGATVDISMDGANLTGADLEGAKFEKDSSLKGAILENANTAGIVFNNAN